MEVVTTARGQGVSFKLLTCFHRLTHCQLVIIAALWISPAQAIPIDNGVLGTSVQCTAEAIAVNFTTRNPFNGRIFVQGMSERPECVRNYADGGPSAPTPIITFTFGECNMQRTRTLSPQQGMLQTIVVVISFHKVFITKVDRAYKIQCFYMESEKTVTAQLDVSMMTTETLRQTSTMPTCSYLVHRGSRTGEVVRYAKIGEPVFHEWECESDQIRILVKSCFADDGQGNKQQILDDKGCAIDPVILADLTYETTGNARAIVESHVFKYADKPTVFFQCSLQICAKGDAQCDAISPPKCLYHTGQGQGQSQRPTVTSLPTPPAYFTKASIRKRYAVTDSAVAVSPESKFSEIDLLTDPIAVLELEDVPSTPKLHEDGGKLRSRSRTTYQNDGFSSSQSQSSVCMSTTGFALLISTVLMLFVCTVASSVFICLGRALCHRRPFKI